MKIRTTDGEKLKFTMMRDTGVFGKLGGAEMQRHGLEAVAAWFTQHARQLAAAVAQNYVNGTKPSLIQTPQCPPEPQSHHTIG